MEQNILLRLYFLGVEWWDWILDLLHEIFTHRIVVDFKSRCIIQQ